MVSGGIVVRMMRLRRAEPWVGFQPVQSKKPKNPRKRIPASSQSPWRKTRQYTNGDYVARTDGCLKTETNDLIQAIVEVKPRIRSAILATVQKHVAKLIVALTLAAHVAAH